MRERARDKGRLEDILEYSNNVTMLIDGYDYNKLVADKKGSKHDPSTIQVRTQARPKFRNSFYY